MALPLLRYDEELPASLLLTPIVQRRNKEDEENAEVVIDKAFEKMKSIQSRVNDEDAMKSSMKEEMKVFIENVMQQQYIKSGNYYEQELLNSYKERISYLEGENKRLVEMLSKLISNTQTVQNCKNVNNKNTTVTKDKMCETELSSTNYCVNEEVRDIPLIVQENHNGEDLNGYRVIKKQLREVRKTKHEQYLKSHSRMKTTLNDNNVIRKATIIGDSMLNGINDDNLSTENIKVVSQIYLRSQDLRHKCKN